MSFSVMDSRDRVLMEVGDEGVAVSRYIDLLEEEKEYVIRVFEEITTEDVEEIRAFLDYKETEDEFCA